MLLESSQGYEFHGNSYTICMYNKRKIQYFHTHYYVWYESHGSLLFCHGWDCSVIFVASKHRYSVTTVSGATTLPSNLNQLDAFSNGMWFRNRKALV